MNDCAQAAGTGDLEHAGRLVEPGGEALTGELTKNDLATVRISGVEVVQSLPLCSVGPRSGGDRASNALIADGRIGAGPIGPGKLVLAGRGRPTVGSPPRHHFFWSAFFGSGFESRSNVNVSPDFFTSTLSSVKRL
jgi:hypothetical protein